MTEQIIEKLTVEELAEMRDEVLLELVKLRMKQVEKSAPALAR